MRRKFPLVLFLLELVHRDLPEEFFKLVKAQALLVGLCRLTQGLCDLLPLSQLRADFKVLEQVLKGLVGEKALAVLILLRVGAKEFLDAAVVLCVIRHVRSSFDGQVGQRNAAHEAPDLPEPTAGSSAPVARSGDPAKQTRLAVSDRECSVAAAGQCSQPQCSPACFPSPSVGNNTVYISCELFFCTQ